MLGTFMFILLVQVGQVGYSIITCLLDWGQKGYLSLLSLPPVVRSEQPLNGGTVLDIPALTGTRTHGQSFEIKEQRYWLE